MLALMNVLAPVVVDVLLPMDVRASGRAHDCACVLGTAAVVTSILFMFLYWLTFLALPLVALARKGGWLIRVSTWDFWHCCHGHVLSQYSSHNGCLHAVRWPRDTLLSWALATRYFSFMGTDYGRRSVPGEVSSVATVCCVLGRAAVVISLLFCSCIGLLCWRCRWLRLLGRAAG